MDISDEIVEAQKFTTEQVEAINAWSNDGDATIKKQYDDDYQFEAKNNSRKIIESVASGFEKDFNFGRPIEKGEHLEVYAKAAFDNHSKVEREAFQQSKLEYDDKIKNFKGSEDIQKELNTVRGRFDTLQAKEAEFDKIMGSGIQDKYDTLLSENEETKNESAFASVIPTFPKEVNNYEKVGRVNEFKAAVLKDNVIKKIEGEYYAIDKENIHKQIKLSALAEGNDGLQALIKGRVQEGLGANQVDLQKVEGIPFDVPKNLDSRGRQEVIKKYLSLQGIKEHSGEHTKQFMALNEKLLQLS